jgi:hypothetical protein
MRADFALLSDGLDTIANMRMRKKQLEVQQRQQEEANALAKARLRLQEEDASERRWDRLGRETAAFGARADRLSATAAAAKARMAAEEAARDPNNPRNQLLAAQKAQAEAAAAATKQRARSPYDVQIEAINAFADEMEKAQTEHAQALAAAQAGDPNAGRIANKAALRLDGLKKLGANLVKEAKAQQEPVVTVELDGPLDEASGKPKGKVSMKVPQSQWNDGHPLFKQFQPATAPAPVVTPTADDGIPTLTPEQARAQPQIKKFRTTDGRLFVR